MIDSITPSSASRSQRRLMSHIRHQSALLLRTVRSSGISPSDARVDDEKAQDMIASYQFVEHAPHPLSLTPNQQSTSTSSSLHRSSSAGANKAQHDATVMAKSASAPRRSRSHFANIEGPLPVAAPIADAPLLSSVSTYSSSSTAVVPLIARRVALPESLNIVSLVSVLPPALAATYGSQDAGSIALLRPHIERYLLDLARPLKPARVAGSRQEYVKLIGRMLAQGMVRFTSSPKVVNGVFAVAKDTEQDRLIIDAQPANRCFVDPPPVALPNPSHLVQLRVQRGAQVYIGKSDLSNYYHHLGLPDWLVDYFALPHLTHAELRSIGVEPSSSGALWPACLTLPMGFSHAVYLAQASHEHVVYSSDALDPEDNIVRLAQPDIKDTGTRHGICIDDFFIFSRNRALASRIFNRVLASYRAAGFVVKPSKVVEPTSEPVKVIGFTVTSGIISIPSHVTERRTPEHQTNIALASDACADLIRSTLALLQRGEATGLGLAHIIGRWTWCMLLRRPSLAALQHSYRFIEVVRGRRLRLWPSVRSELWMLLGLLPLLHARIDVPVYPHVLASDASELGAGVVCCTMTPELKQHIWSRCSARSSSLLQIRLNAADLKGTLEHLLDELDDDESFNRIVSSEDVRATATECADFYSSVAAAPRRTIISHRWRSPEHINVLELRAVLLALHWLLTYPSSHFSRVYLLVDSTVTLFSLWKGRSSSPRLLLILRKINVLLLAGGVSLLTGWLPSARNPADRPSRYFGDGDDPPAASDDE